MRGARNGRVRIGGCSGFWGDTLEGPRQLVERGDIDFLVGDYLSEITMSLLARAKAKDPSAGYAPEFVRSIAPVLRDLAEKRIRVVVNAGGLNAGACAQAVGRAAEAAGVSLRIATVEGDDLMDRLDLIRARAPVDIDTGQSLPQTIVSANAYLGAREICAALDEGADVVITGRCVDSALTLGPLMHVFQWAWDDYDRLSAGSLAGHLIECGAQVTGGLFTDWEAVPGWDDMGLPVVEVAADGRFTVTKPLGTGGLVSTATVAEQLLYEIGDPGAYALPDVVCDWTHVRLRQTATDWVEVTGAVGWPPTDKYKVCLTYKDGYRALGTAMVAGFDASLKARRQGDAILDRAVRLASRDGYGPYQETSVELIGAEDSYGAGRRPGPSREVLMKVAARHQERGALDVFSREFFSCGTSMAQGTTGFFGGRPKVTPVFRLFSCLLDKAEIEARIRLDAEILRPLPPRVAPRPLAPPTAPPVVWQPGDESRGWPRAGAVEVPLRAVAWGRSGDKGDKANIGIIARNAAFVESIRAQLTPERVATWFTHYAPNRVSRWEAPGINGFNFLLERVLGGGGIASLRYDPQGKAFAAILLEHPIQLSPELAQHCEVAK